MVLRRIGLDVLAVCALCTSPLAVSAQDLVDLPVPVVEISAGYAVMRDTTGDEQYPAGWYFSGGWNLNQLFGLVAEAGGSYRSQDLSYSPAGIELSDKRRVYTFLAGPRFFHRTGRLVPFVQVLAGLAQREIDQREVRVGNSAPSTVSYWRPSYNYFAVQPGGGLTVYLTERVGVRVAGDYRCIVDENNDDVRNEYRFLTGFTFHWGNR
ncbi:MAG TPA: hypothetical protein VD833_08210 [Vicinamibacterales bacterium]|nr:hypothetical protein [Vicinamibacterales bacterium]